MNRSPADDGLGGTVCRCRRGAHPSRLPHSALLVDRLDGRAGSAAKLTGALDEHSVAIT
ncbi:hypothetical protein [Streptomyces flaveolus]|uniref:hypothetical protein n=1 Tax=Streptomyces flaveolus TaxID=67297 RepID=UPI0036F8CB8B